MTDVKQALDESPLVQYFNQQYLAGETEQGHLVFMTRAGYWFPREIANSLGEDWDDKLLSQIVASMEWRARYLDNKSRELGHMCKIIRLIDQDGMRSVGSNYLSILYLYFYLSLLHDRKLLLKSNSFRHNLIRNLHASSSRLFWGPFVQFASNYLKLFHAYYPEFLGLEAMINVGGTFKVIFSMLSPMVSARTLSKILILGDSDDVVVQNQLLGIFPKRILPVQYGGEKVNIKNIFPLPPLSRVQLEAVGSELLFDNQDDVIIGAGQSRVLLVDTTPGKKVRYGFDVDSYDIDFALKFITDDGRCREIVPCSRLSGGKSGSYTPHGPGQLLFSWDNSYAWMTAKRLRYKVSARASIDFGSTKKRRGSSPKEMERQMLEAAAAAAAAVSAASAKPMAKAVAATTATGSTGSSSGFSASETATGAKPATMAGTKSGSQRDRRRQEHVFSASSAVEFIPGQYRKK